MKRLLSSLVCLVFAVGLTAYAQQPLPPLNVQHLRALSSPRGLSEFARGTEPAGHRFCIEDTARGLVAALKIHAMQPIEDADELAELYLRAIASLQKPDGNFYFAYRADAKPTETTASGDNFTRVLWGLGHASSFGLNESMKARSTDLFERALARYDPAREGFIAQTYAIQGLALFLQAHRTHAAAQGKLRASADRLLSLLPTAPDGTAWLWPSSKVTYDSARLPLAFFLAYEASHDARYLEAGKRTLDFLLRVNFPSDGAMLRVIGNQGWYQAGSKSAEFDQQPIDASALVEACAAAWRLTREERYRAFARTAFSWFLGNNVCAKSLYDATSGGCRDGLVRSGVNPNEGAESTVSYLIARTEMETVTH